MNSINNNKFFDISLEIKYKTNALYPVEKYLECAFHLPALDSTNPKLQHFYPQGPLVDASTIYYYQARQIINYFCSKEQTKSNFNLDLEKLDFANSLPLLEDTFVIEIKLKGDVGKTVQLGNNPFHEKYPYTANQVFDFLHLTFQFLPSLLENNKLVHIFSIFSLETHYNLALIFSNMLRLQFYSNTIDINQIKIFNKKKILVYFTLGNFLTSVIFPKELNLLPKILIYDSNKTLEEIYVEEPWLYQGKSYKIN